MKEYILKKLKSTPEHNVSVSYGKIINDNRFNCSEKQFFTIGMILTCLENKSIQLKDNGEPETKTR